VSSVSVTIRAKTALALPAPLPKHENAANEPGDEGVVAGFAGA
jgi:hypothetical protein